ncbi:MAG: SRPBCC domain-containing protein [bacterium]
MLNPIKATTTKKIFSRTTSLQVVINSKASKIWALLADANNYPKWNSTVISIVGNIGLDEKIELKSTLSPDRIFKLKISEFEPNKKLVWGDAMGKRIYTLSEQADGATLFSMSEKIGGPAFPLFASMIPDFDESFETFAKDLKKAAEKN